MRKVKDASRCLFGGQFVPISTAFFWYTHCALHKFYLCFYDMANITSWEMSDCDWLRNCYETRIYKHRKMLRFGYDVRDQWNMRDALH